MSQIHSGHRARVLERLDREGLDAFQPHEVLELLLFFAIPRSNVNPLAHLLIERFGSLEAVLQAPVELLREQPGVGLATAEWLCSIPSVLSTYKQLRMEDRLKLDRLKKVVDYGEQLFESAKDQQIWILNLSSHGHLLHSAPMAEGKDLIRRVALRSLMDTVLRYHARTVVLLQKRVASQMRLTDEDVRFTEELNSALCAIGVYLMDNVLMCGAKRTSFRELGLLELQPVGEHLHEEPVYLLTEDWLADDEGGSQ